MRTKIDKKNANAHNCFTEKNTNKGHSFCKQCLHDLQFMKTRSSSPNLSKLTSAISLWKQDPCAELFTKWMDFRHFRIGCCHELDFRNTLLNRLKNSRKLGMYSFFVKSCDEQLHYYFIMISSNSKSNVLWFHNFINFKIHFCAGTNLFGPLGHRMGRWLASFIGLSLIGLALIFVSFIAFPQLKAENHISIPCLEWPHLNSWA